MLPLVGTTINASLSAVEAVFDGYQYGLRFEFFVGLPAILKAEPFKGTYISGTGHPYRHFWLLKELVVDAHIEALAAAVVTGRVSRISALVEHPLLYEDQTALTERAVERLRQVIAEARQQPVPRAFVHGFNGQLYPLKNGGFMSVTAFHRGAIAVARRSGGKYAPSCRGWLVARASADLFKDELVRELQLTEREAASIVVMDGEYEFKENSHGSEPWIRVSGKVPEPRGLPGEDEVAGALLATVDAFRDDHGEESFAPVNLDHYPIKDYQAAGIRFLIPRSSALLADDPGLGKTRQAVIAAFIKLQSILSRADDTYDADDTTGKARDATFVAEEKEHCGPGTQAPGTEFGARRNQILIIAPASLVINWQREIHMVFPTATTVVRDYDPMAEWVICNYELLGRLTLFAHRFAVMVVDEAHYLKEPAAERTRLTFEIAARVPVRYLLTGTPVLNREAELHTLLHLSGHPIGLLPLNEFQATYAGSHVLRNNLGGLISDWMLRRRKNLVLRDLKGRQRQVLRLPLPDAAREEYDALMRDGSKYSLEKVISLRMLLERERVDVIVRFFQDLLPTDKLLVFTEFRETVNLLKRRLTSDASQVVTIVGDDTPAKRQKAIDAFQQNDDVRALVATFGAGATGNNLQAANYVACASLPWTPGLLDQAESRADRQGQTRLVISKIFLFEGTLDDIMWAMLDDKAQVANDIVNAEAVLKRASLLDLLAPA